MASRATERTPGFERCLKRLSKKHPSLCDTVNDALEGYASTGKTAASDQIQGLDGRPVFKERLSICNQGKRKGPRIIYYCDSHRVVGMFLYTKNEQDDVPVKEIKKALEETGLPDYRIA